MSPDIAQRHLHFAIARGSRLGGCLTLATVGLCSEFEDTLLGLSPVNPGAQMHVPFRPSLSQVPPFRQLMLAQGSLYSSQCVPAEKQTKKVTHGILSGPCSLQKEGVSPECDSIGIGS